MDGLNKLMAHCPKILIEGFVWKNIGNGVLTRVSMDSMSFKVRHVSHPFKYEVSVNFGYAMKFGNLLSDIEADHEFWKLVEGALIHIINKETDGKLTTT
jgi:hypothetical protein